MREIDTNDFYTGIKINQTTQYYHANQNTKEWERWSHVKSHQVFDVFVGEQFDFWV